MKAPLLVKTPAQLGQIFRARRRAEKISQAALAGQIGITQTTLSKLESQPDALPLERLLRLCEVLGLEILVQKRADGEPTATEW